MTTENRKEVSLRISKEDESKTAIKLLNGHLLTPKEWEIAKIRRMFKVPLDTPYSAFYRTFYEDETHRGYLCVEKGKIKSGIIAREGNKTTICMWGIHREDVNPEKLRDDQKDMW